MTGEVVELQVPCKTVYHGLFTWSTTLYGKTIGVTKPCTDLQSPEKSLLHSVSDRGDSPDRAARPFHNTPRGISTGTSYTASKPRPVGRSAVEKILPGLAGYDPLLDYRNCDPNTSRCKSRRKTLDARRSFEFTYTHQAERTSYHYNFSSKAQDALLFPARE